MKQPHFSSLRLDWKTPKAVYQVLDSEFRFDCDPCPPNHTEDGLTSPWGGCNYVNPPYGRELPKWIAKGYEEWKKGKIVVFLIPSRTDTRWWHDYCMKATEIRYIKGRLKFDDQKNPAPFPSAIVVFNQSSNKSKGEKMKVNYTDEHFLHQYFHLYLDKMYGIASYNNPKYWFMDGFEEPLDPDYLCDAIYDLAERLGYKLVNNMWVTQSSNKSKGEK